MLWKLWKSGRARGTTCKPWSALPSICLALQDPEVVSNHTTSLVAKSSTQMQQILLLRLSHAPHQSRIMEGCLERLPCGRARDQGEVELLRLIPWLNHEQIILAMCKNPVSHGDLGLAEFYTNPLPVSSKVRIF